MLRAMNEDQAIEILAHFWNNAGGHTRLSMVRILFDGYPPPRLTSTEDLMKFTYPINQITIESSKFMEVFKDARSEAEQLSDLEANTWPKISLKNQQKIFNFLQLTNQEKSRYAQARQTIIEGHIFDSAAIEMNNVYYLPCDKGQTCDPETPSCIVYKGRSVCVKQCVGDPNCFAFADPYYKRAWPGKCMAQQHVCEGFSYYDERQDKGSSIPFTGKANGNGWSIAEATFPWSSATDSSVVRIFSFLLPILVLCIFY